MFVAQVELNPHFDRIVKIIGMLGIQGLTQYDKLQTRCLCWTRNFSFWLLMMSSYF